MSNFRLVDLKMTILEASKVSNGDYLIFYQITSVGNFRGNNCYFEIYTPEIGLFESEIVRSFKKKSQSWKLSL